MVLPDRTADAVAEVVLLVAGFWRPGNIEVVVRVERFVAGKLPKRSVKFISPGLGFDLDGSGSVLAVLRPVIRGQYLHLFDGLDAGIDIQGEVAPIVHHVAAVDFPVVVLGAAAVNAVADAAFGTDDALILSGLIADTGNQSDELGKIASVKFQLRQLFAGDCAAQFGRLGIHLGKTFAVDRDFFVETSHCHRDVNAGILRNTQDHAFRQIGAESRE